MTRMSSAERRELLVRAAIRVIARGGVGAATTRAIVAEADMSLASFHYAFRSHDEMMRDVVAWVVEAEVDAVYLSIERGADIRSAFRAGLQAYFDHLKADPGHEQVIQELVHFALRTPGLEHLATEQYERYHSAVTALLTEGAEASGIEWAMPVEDLARLVVTVTGGVTIAWLADRDDDAARRVLDLAADSLSGFALPAAALASPALSSPARSTLARSATARPTTARSTTAKEPTA
jgi:AcrR family transcriptional regulator